ncbi:unnamed protein product [Alopecurus aequalis]
MSRVEALSMSGLSAIPAEYIRPQSERQGLGDAYDQAAMCAPLIPVVDVAVFDPSDPGSAPSLAVVDAVRAAAAEWGVMHVAGHGIPSDLLDALRAAGTGFFGLPIEDKEAYANDPAAGQLQGYGSKLAANQSGQREWEDYLFHLVHPDHAADHGRWPAHPPEYVPVTRQFGELVSGLASRLLAILSLGLGVPAPTLEHRLRRVEDKEHDEEELLDLLLKLKINYYPVCPQPDLAVGVEAHTDVSALSFILTNGVPGLQVKRGDSEGWVTARDEPGTLVVHVGDALEILSNGRYTSVLHRGLVNRVATRVSWVVFAEPPPDRVLLQPLPELLADGQEQPRFAPRTFRQHLEHKVLKKKQSEEEEAKKAPVAPKLLPAPK